MRLAWFFGILSLALLIGLAVYLLPLNPSIVVLQFCFRPESFQAVMTQWQPTGVALFRSHLPVDSVLLMSYGLFGYLLSMRNTVLRRYLARRPRYLSLLMPLAACADAVEDGLHWVFTGSDGEAWMWLVPLAAICSCIKFTGITLFGIAVWRAHRSTPKFQITP
jgi:hypothetical protein